MKSTCRPFLLLLALALVGGFSPALRAEPAEVASLRARAEKGNGIAQYNLGSPIRRDARTCPPTLIEAFVWLSLAAENGSTGKALDIVLNKITDEQMAEGRRRLAVRRATLPAKPAALVSAASKPASNPKPPVAPATSDDTTSLSPRSTRPGARHRPLPPPKQCGRRMAAWFPFLRKIPAANNRSSPPCARTSSGSRPSLRRLGKTLKKARADSQAAATELVSLHGARRARISRPPWPRRRRIMPT